jgi:hypothetical protein
MTAAGPSAAGLGCSAGLLGWKGWVGLGGVLGIKVWVSNQIEFKLLNLNSNNQKKCSSMYATINSYISLTLF